MKAQEDLNEAKEDLNLKREEIEQFKMTVRKVLWLLNDDH